MQIIIFICQNVKKGGKKLCVNPGLQSHYFPTNKSSANNSELSDSRHERFGRTESHTVQCELIYRFRLGCFCATVTRRHKNSLNNKNSECCTRVNRGDLGCVNSVVLCVLFGFNDDILCEFSLMVAHGCCRSSLCSTCTAPHPQTPPPPSIANPSQSYHAVVRWCVSFLNTPAVLPWKRLRDGGGRTGVGGWSATAVIT